MTYTIFLTRQDNRQWQAIVPGLPDCTIEAPSRAQALVDIQDRVRAIVTHSEVLRLEMIPSTASNESPTFEITTTPWKWFGIGKEDESWQNLFAEIESERDENLIEVV